MTVAYPGKWKSTNPVAATSSVAIVGGGASGALMAAHLLRDGNAGVSVTIVEKRSAVGQGLAYSTDVPEHLLNVRASNMSAFADDSDHFVRWLGARGFHSTDWTTSFAPRRVYGEYLADLLRVVPDNTGRPGSLAMIGNECVDVVLCDSQVELRFADGSSIATQYCILATGHDEKQCREAAGTSYARPYGPVAASDPVLIVGSGLSMVDSCLSLLLQGHVGPIHAVSRRGLLPAVHTRTSPVAFDQSGIPLSNDLSEALRWFRRLVRATEARGGNWRDVVDGLRPYNQRIWQGWPEPVRRRFFRHLKAWWDIHRHRMAPKVHDRIAKAIAERQLQVIAGRLLDVQSTTDGFTASVQRRGTNSVEQIRAAHVYDCSGVIADPTRTSNPAIRSLLKSGAARPDPLRIGLDVSQEGALIGENGVASERVYAIGPLTRGTFFEIEAVPDIRVQCQQLSKALMRHGS
jgi:uncharacterized NAD(P)/FAD-binding protein YdhS